MSKQLTIVADERSGITMAHYIDGTLGPHEEYAVARLVGHLISSESGAVLFRSPGLESGSTT